MKVSVEKTETKFEPVKITVTLESKQEMVNLMTLLQQNGTSRMESLKQCSVFTKTDKVDISGLQRQMGDIYFRLFAVWEDR